MGRSRQEKATRELTEAVRKFTEVVEIMRRQNEEAQERLFWLYHQRPVLEAESLRRWLSEAVEAHEEIAKGVVVLPVPYAGGGGLEEESSVELALRSVREMREEVERPPGEPAPGPEEIRRRREERRRREAESEDRA